MRPLVLGIVAAALLSSETEAHSPTPPLLTGESIRGTWEGVLSTEPRVLVMQIDQKESFVAMAIGPGPLLILKFKVEKLDVAAGHFSIECVGLDDDREYRLLLTGKGRVFDGEGEASVNATLRSSRRRDRPSSWTGTLVMRPEGYAAAIAASANAARRATIKYRTTSGK